MNYHDVDVQLIQTYSKGSLSHISRKLSMLGNIVKFELDSVFVTGNTFKFEPNLVYVAGESQHRQLQQMATGLDTFQFTSKLDSLRPGLAALQQTWSCIPSSPAHTYSCCL